MSRLHQITSYLSHWLNVVDKHSIHSPFFFDFYNNIIHGTETTNEFGAIEKLRDSLLLNKTLISVEDLGAGSKLSPHADKRMIAEVTRMSVSPAVVSQLYYRMVKHFNFKYIIELGTSVGLNTLYLSIDPNCKVFTFEGSATLNNIALTHFEAFDKKNIIKIEGNIDSTLPNFLQNTSKIDFVILDANHRYEPTIRYFNQLQRRLTEKSVMVIDDIHWSEEMEKAWIELSRHELVYGSVDLYRCGILFFDPALNRQHFILSL